MHEFPQIIDKPTQHTGTPRVLIVRLSAIGDCVQTFPLACAVRDHWPTAHITWVVEKVSAPLVAACDAVDRVVTIPKRFSTSFKLLRALRTQLHSTPFDLVLDPQGLTKSGLVSWLSGARRRIGFARPASREFNPILQTELVKSTALHRIDRYLELLRPLGIHRPNVRYGLELPPATIATAKAIATRPELHTGYAVINPGAGWDSKRWPIERFAEVARHLGARSLPSLVVWAGQAERAMAEEIVSKSAGSAHLAPPTTLLELAAFLQSASIFVSADTGPLHLAAAVGTPCVALFGASRGDACGPYGSGHKTLQFALDIAPGRKRPGADNWAMRTIGSQSVYAACDAILSAKAGPLPTSAAA
jgi:heptosyltransferase-1